MKTPYRERPVVYAGALALAAFLAVLALRQSGALQPLELAVYDRWLVSRAALLDQVGLREVAAFDRRGE